MRRGPAATTFGGGAFSILLKASRDEMMSETFVSKTMPPMIISSRMWWTCVGMGHRTNMRAEY